MKIKGEMGKWAGGVLGVICLVLLLNLVRSGVSAGGEKPSQAPARTPDVRRHSIAPAGVKNEFSHYDPEVRLDLLSDVQARPLPKIERNPFEFPPPPKLEARSRDFIGPKLPPAIPPPPPPPVKAIGSSEKGNGVKEAILSDDDGIYVVHEGETFAKRYKVTKVSSTAVEIYDETTHQTVSLPVPL